MKPPRLITTFEGKFINVGDFKEALKDDKFIEECGHVLAVAYQKGDGTIQAVRYMIGAAMMRLAGEENRLAKPEFPANSIQKEGTP